MTIYEALCFLLGSTIVAISSSSDNMNEVNSEDPSHKSVYWTVETNPVIFGRNVTLLCIIANVENDCLNCSKRWHGGTELSLLSYNGYPSKNTKYVPSTDHSGFGIIITQFNKEDLNVYYSCSYGPFFDKKNLTEDMLHIKKESGDDDSPEQLNSELVAVAYILLSLALIGIVTTAVSVCLVKIKKNKHKESREHIKSDVEKKSTNIANAVYAQHNLMKDYDLTEKFSQQNSKDVLFSQSDKLLTKASV
ncbi:uncharacterized protein LOC134721588 [Mytilus trossulus]|uniref:uncharacterized protein LOC134721588 n=1 Tax=Mytilus trossulus TaxID=6551 RepID=UPI003005FD51